MESVEYSPPLPTVIYNFDPAEDLVALVAVDQSETIVTVEEDGKDAVIFIGNSALARVIGAAKTLTAAHVTFMSEDVAGTLGHALIFRPNAEQGKHPKWPNRTTHLECSQTNNGTPFCARL